MRRIAWLALSIAANVIIAGGSQAQTNSYISSMSSFWQNPSLWSLGVAPSITQSAILITNSAGETVTIDGTTANSFTSTMTISNLTISTPTLVINNTGSIALHIRNSLIIEGHGSVLLTNGGLLVVTNGPTSIESGTMTLTNANFLGADVILGGVESIGDLVINNGTVALSGVLSIAAGGDISDGSVILNGGTLVVTNETINAGGQSSNGQLDILGGTFLGQGVFLLGGGVLSIQGGISILSSNLGFGFGGTLFVGGGELFTTNTTTFVNNGMQCTVTGGLWSASSIDLGVGAMARGGVSISGGSITTSTGITLGDCASNAIGQVFLTGGQLIATNAAHTGFIDVRNGELALSNGVVRVDKLVMTNSCSSFVHTGGTLIAGSVVLDPNEFRITSIAREGNNFRVTWLMGPGQTNTLQVSTGDSHGGYSTNSFADIFVVTNNTITGTLTNYLDLGGATNKPSRYYRARLVP